MLYSRTLLFIHSLYNSLHLLILNSQLIPPLPLPLATTNLSSNHFFTSIWTHGNLFHTLGYNLALYFFAVKLSQFCSLGVLSVPHSVPFIDPTPLSPPYPHHCELGNFCFILLLQYFLTLWHYFLAFQAYLGNFLLQSWDQLSSSHQDQGTRCAQVVYRYITEKETAAW